MIETKIICDSVNEWGDRITTATWKYPRYIHAEVMTYRKFCLAGDSVLQFDLPTGTKDCSHRVYKMSIKDFVNKWVNGAKRGETKKKTNYDLSWIEPEQAYNSKEIALNLGMKSSSNIDRFCREGVLASVKNGRKWEILGKNVIKWRLSKPESTDFDCKSRLGSMRIRQLNENTGKVQLSRVSNACFSGSKEVFEVRAGKYRIAGSKDHRVLTFSGWKTISELKTGDLLAVQKFGKKDCDKNDPKDLKFIESTWRCKWQKEMRQKLISENKWCRKCGFSEGVLVHHIIPVYKNKSLAFDESNIILLCENCHKKEHLIQDWQGGTELYCGYEPISEVVLRGEEETYDLEIEGEFPNFIANNVVVHNSRNSASSRAIPVEKMIARVETDPVIPIHWGKNQAGMSAQEEVSEEIKPLAVIAWKVAALLAVVAAKRLHGFGIHKQVVNRLLEPFLWHEIIVTSTDFSNFFEQRCSPFAQPEIRILAEKFREEYKQSKPKLLAEDEWHLPLVNAEDWDSLRDYSCDKDRKILLAKKLSVARCARVSYLQHDGTRSLGKDLELYEKLLGGGHYSPFEHCATPLKGSHANFDGWLQHRTEIGQ